MNPGIVALNSIAKAVLAAHDALEDEHEGNFRAAVFTIETEAHALAETVRWM